MASSNTNRAAIWLFLGAILIGGVTAAYLYTKKQEMAGGGETAVSGQVGDVASKLDSGDAGSQSGDAETGNGQPAADGNVALPRFDVLRVEKDGSTVVAGSAPGGSMVRLLANGQEIAQGKASPAGDFAIVLDQPLAAGDYELKLEATDFAGNPVVSSETGVVSVPAQGGELLAMVTEEGKASRVMQVPEASASKSGEVASQAPSAPAAGAPTDGKAPEGETAEGKPMETAKLGQEGESDGSVKTAPMPESGGADAGVEPVMVQAVDVEGSTMFIAGSGAPGRDVNIYLDDAYLGTTQVSAGGTFLLETSKALNAGTYTIRADMLALDGAKVERRASVQLQHQLPEQTAEAATQPMAEKPAEPMEVAEAGKATGTAPAATQTESVAQTAPPADAGSAAELDSANAQSEPVADTAPVTAMAGEETKPAKTGAAPEQSTEQMPAVETPANDLPVVQPAETAAPAAEMAMKESPEKESAIAQKSAETGGSDALQADQPIAERKQVEMAANIDAKPGEQEQQEAQPEKQVATGGTDMAKPAEPMQQDVASQQAESGSAEMTKPAEPMQQDAAAQQQPQGGGAADISERMAANSEDATPVIKTGASVIIRRGDNLWRISRRMLGRGIRYTVIYEANRDQISDPDLIFPGQVFDVPGGKEAGNG